MQKQELQYYSYVYRITNKEENKHYYGSRVCKMSKRFSINALEDLKEYKSTSSLKDFKTLQIERPEIFKYKIIKIFKTKNEAIEYESLLHKKFNVKDNPKFYNKHNQLKQV